MSVLSLTNKLQTTKLSLDEHGILTLTLHRPSRRNAFTQRMSDELVEIYRVADLDRAVRLILMTGHGEYFCAGADLQIGTTEPLLGAMAEQLASAVTYRDLAGRVVLAILACRKPCIAAINGAAVGVGITMTLAMDFRIVASDAKIGFVFTRRGLLPEGCSSALLAKLVGQTRALDWCLTGRIFKAAEAENSGLFTKVVARNDVLKTAMDYALMVATKCSPVMTVLARALLWQGLDTDFHKTHLIESKALNHSLRHEDTAEGFASFLEKRNPEFPSNMNDNLPSFYPWWTTTNVDSPLGGINIRANL